MGATSGKEESQHTTHADKMERELRSRAELGDSMDAGQGLMSCSMFRHLDEFSFIAVDKTGVERGNGNSCENGGGIHDDDKVEKIEAVLDVTALSDASSMHAASSSLPNESQQKHRRSKRILFCFLGIFLLAGTLVGIGVYAAAKMVANKNDEADNIFEAPEMQNQPALAPTGIPGNATPTGAPSWRVTGTPTDFASPDSALQPTSIPMKALTTNPTAGPTTVPTGSPTTGPTGNPTTDPTNSPTGSPSNSPTNSPTVAPATWMPTMRTATYIPGNLTRKEAGLLLSEGLRARIIARSGEPVEYHNGALSDINFHGRPDFGATFADSRPFNEGGWVCKPEVYLQFFTMVLLTFFPGLCQ